MKHAALKQHFLSFEMYFWKYTAKIETKNRTRMYNLVVIRLVNRIPREAHFHGDGTDFPPWRNKWLHQVFLSRGLSSEEQVVALSSGHSKLFCSSATLIRHLVSRIVINPSSLRMETDSHNQRHKSYRGTCRTVTTATGHVGGGGLGVGVGASSSARLAVGGLVQRFSLVGLFCPQRQNRKNG